MPAVAVVRRAAGSGGPAAARRGRATLVVAALAVTAACMPAGGTGATASRPATATRSPTTAGTAPGRPVVVLDPGHNGGNAARPDLLARRVDAGYGRTKPCNTDGASTAAGYPEHAFAWDVVVRTRALLAARGVRVVVTRRNDTGVGPCVDARGRSGNAVRADAVVSVHADNAGPSSSGFHVIEATRTPGGPAVARETRRLALAVRAALRSGSGLGYAGYTGGGDGLHARDDLAGLSLSRRPTVMVECGNMGHRRDAALLSAPAGRQRIAAALAAGLLRYLAGR